MTVIERYTLGKTERLKSRKDIERVFKEGKSFSNFPFRVVYLQAPAQETSSLQAGFSVSTRYFKKAVDRNRVKRLMREAYRLQKNKLTATLKKKHLSLLVFIIYTGNVLPDSSEVSEKTGSILKRLIKFASENSEANS